MEFLNTITNDINVLLAKHKWLKAELVTIEKSNLLTCDPQIIVDEGNFTINLYLDAGCGFTAGNGKGARPSVHALHSIWSVVPDIFTLLQPRADKFVEAPGSNRKITVDQYMHDLTARYDELTDQGIITVNDNKIIMKSKKSDDTKSTDTKSTDTIDSMLTSVDFLKSLSESYNKTLEEVKSYEQKIRQYKNMDFNTCEYDVIIDEYNYMLSLLTLKENVMFTVKTTDDGVKKLFTSIYANANESAYGFRDRIRKFGYGYEGSNYIRDFVRFKQDIINATVTRLTGDITFKTIDKKMSIYYQLGN